MSPIIFPSFLALLLVAAEVRRTAATKAQVAQPHPPIDCHYLNSQRSLALDKMLGVWYAVEVVEHFTQDVRTGHTDLPQCPVFTLTEEKRNSTQSPLIRLLWKEGDAFSVEYSLIMPEKYHKGFWRSTGTQNGSLAENSRYRQFSGTVHIMRATGDHAVLTFCSETELQVFSVLLSREPTMRQSEVRSINNMLERRGLPVTYTKSTCRAHNGVSANIATELNMAGAVFIILLLTTVVLH
ncbi:uncharacterized protein [Anabrus simplex]|uniref:uncharacterized protein n=1 Tax=Anabrus simplex TaxID=316456 RepID=UPI0035A3211E